MDINVSKVIQYSVSKVKLNGLSILKRNGVFSVYAPFEWVDTNGMQIYSNLKVFKDEELATELGTITYSALKNAFNSLMGTGDANLLLKLEPSISGLACTYVVVDGKNVWTNVTVTNEQFIAALSANSISLDSFNALIAGMCQSVVANA